MFFVVDNLFISFLKNIKIFLNFHSFRMPKSQTEINVLRERYYSNLTFIDQMAKTFGELNYLSKLLLEGSVISSLSIPFLLTHYPGFIFLIICLIPFFWFLEVQFQAMEKRFLQLVADLEITEVQLEHALKRNVELEKKLEESLQQNNKITKQIEESYLEIQKLQNSLQKKEKNMEKSCDMIESSAQKIHQIFKDFISIKHSTINNSQLFLEQINQACSLVEKTCISLDEIQINDDELKQSKLFTKSMEEYLENNFIISLNSNEEEIDLSPPRLSIVNC